jgi:hypothetical protein
MMSVALACTWRPRGEWPRLERLRPSLEAVYERLIVALPPDADLADAAPLRDWPMATVIASPQRGWGRYLAVQSCLATAATHVHYADLDAGALDRDAAGGMARDRGADRDDGLPDHGANRASLSHASPGHPAD